jgi:hypothetical protein
MKIGITHISKEISARFKNSDQIKDLYGVVDEVEFHDLSIGVRGGWCTQAGSFLEEVRIPLESWYRQS